MSATPRLRRDAVNPTVSDPLPAPLPTRVEHSCLAWALQALEAIPEDEYTRERVRATLIAAI
jgi:hypothetical protein